MQVEISNNNDRNISNQVAMNARLNLGKVKDNGDIVWIAYNASKKTLAVDYFANIAKLTAQFSYFKYLKYETAQSEENEEYTSEPLKTRANS